MHVCLGASSCLGPLILSQCQLLLALHPRKAKGENSIWGGHSLRGPRTTSSCSVNTPLCPWVRYWPKPQVAILTSPPLGGSAWGAQPKAWALRKLDSIKEGRYWVGWSSLITAS